jgi:endoglucanase
MAMAGVGDRASYAPFVALWSRDAAPAPVEVETGAAGQSFGGGGYDRISALTLCAARKIPLPADFFASRLADSYYPASLQLLAVLAAQMRYGSCLRS